jgi:carbonic anhydrase
VGVHGWFYSLKTGVINDMKVSTTDNAKMDSVFRFK